MMIFHFLFSSICVENSYMDLMKILESQFEIIQQDRKKPHVIIQM